MNKYQIIYADPPWQYKDKGGAERHYNTIDNDKLSLMPIQDLCADDCALFMWATFPKMQDALDLIKAWGFTYKTNAFTWVKKNKVEDSLFWGMGRWTRANAEVCLLATKGKPKRVDMGVHSVVEAKIMKHSQKPDEVAERIVRLCGELPRLEMFARQQRKGWDLFGNEVENSITV